MENEELENVDKAVISGTQRVSSMSIDLIWLVFGENIEINGGLLQNTYLLPLVCFSFANTAKGWVQPFDAMLRAAHGSTTSPARQPVDPSSQ